MNPDDLLVKKSQAEITYTVSARAKVYRTSTEVYIPKIPFDKNMAGYEPTEPIVTGARDAIATSDEDKLERSIRRTKISVRDIFMCNSFDLFVTFTFKAERADIDKCKTKMSGWLKRQRRTDKSFQYVIVPEFHKDGISLHFHALIKNYSGKIIRAYNPNTHKQLIKNGRKVWDFPNYTLGHSEVSMIGETEEDKMAIGFYLLKYVRKDMPVFASKKRYWASRGLAKPLVIENPEKWYLVMEPEKFFEIKKDGQEYGKILYFNNEKIDIFLPKRNAN